jgi:hypothetical protein
MSRPGCQHVEGDARFSTLTIYSSGRAVSLPSRNEKSTRSSLCFKDYNAEGIARSAVPWGGSMRLRPTRLLFPSLLLLGCLSTDLNSQTTTSGGLTGVVTDSSHAVVLGADVEIRDTAKGTTQSTKTDREGVYRFFFLAPGRYTLAVTRDGFRKESRGVNVLLGPPVSVNVVLAMAQANTTVTVTEEAPLLQAENGDVSTTLDQKQISEVPNPGNDLTYIAQTAPGVVMDTDMQGFANFCKTHR